MKEAATPRIEGLDTLRALAIALVFMNHYMLFVTDGPTFGFLSRIGWSGVDLFFALSGYLIGNQIFSAMRARQSLSLPRFYARRLLRTLPAFYVVLALYYWWPGFRAGAELLPVWKFITFTQNYMLNPGTAFSHAWSLCVEEQFYLLLPAAALLIATRRHALFWSWMAVGACFVAGALVRAYLWEELVDDNPLGRLHYYKYIYYSSFCRFDELVAGVALALLKNFHLRAWTRLIAHGNALLALGMCVLLLTYRGFIDDYFGLPMTVIGYPLLALGFALLIVAAVSPGSLLCRTRVPGAAKLALWSYAIYLTHKQACILLEAPLQRLGHEPGSLSAIAAMIGVSLACGAMLYYLVEAPFMALRQRWVPSNLKIMPPR